MKIPELSEPGGKQTPMVEEQAPGWHTAVVDAVRAMEEAARERELLSVGTTSRRLAGAIEVTETTALRYLRGVIGAGKLVEIGHAGRRLLLPWPEGTQSPPDVWVTGEVKRGSFRVTEHREPGPAMAKIRFVMTPERLAALMQEKLAAQEETAARKQREVEERASRRAVEEAEQREVFAKHYPVLAGLLARFAEEVEGPEDSGLGVRLNAREHPALGVVARVHIEVGDERLDVLERILRDGLGEGAGPSS
ncbi:hypothetical protein [Streptomyces sp. NPDC088360]|uniref:hypothetical protein n=1 Tax=Streptomyces sp. NPDC088360 TaxID=3154515 RepID=UPI00344B9103